MELWIRSQKNEELRPMLLKVNEFEIGDYDEDMNCIVVNNLHCVGIYKTKERALQVLDEIQNILQPRIITHEPVIDYDDMIHSLSENVVMQFTQQSEIELKQAGQVVYQMPEE